MTKEIGTLPPAFYQGETGGRKSNGQRHTRKARTRANVENPAMRKTAKRVSQRKGRKNVSRLKVWQICERYHVGGSCPFTDETDIVLQPDSNTGYRRCRSARKPRREIRHNDRPCDAGCSTWNTPDTETRWLLPLKDVPRGTFSLPYAEF